MHQLVETPAAFKRRNIYVGRLRLGVRPDGSALRPDELAACTEVAQAIAGEVVADREPRKTTTRKPAQAAVADGALPSGAASSLSETTEAQHRIGG
jgi:hypothetical protein